MAIVRVNTLIEVLHDSCHMQHARSHNSSNNPESPALPPSTAEPLQPQPPLTLGDPQAQVVRSEAPVDGDCSVQTDLQADVQVSNTTPHTEHGERQSPAADQPDDSQQLDHPSDSPSARTSQQERDPADSADSVVITDRQSQSPDQSAPSAVHPHPANADTPQHNTTPLDSFGSLIETRPDSNGNAGTSNQETSTSELQDPGPAATAADDQAEDTCSMAEPATELQTEQQAEQQLPVSGLYASSQVDQTSRDSLPESEEMVLGSQQQPDSPSSTVQAGDHHQISEQMIGASPPWVNERSPGSQQSSQDNHEQQAELPGTLPWPSTHASHCCQEYSGFCIVPIALSP